MTHRVARLSITTALLFAATTLRPVAAPAAEPVLQHQSCSIGSSLSTCPQLDPAKGKLVSIDVKYSVTNVFKLAVVGDAYTTTTFDVWIWQELDTNGGDIGSFYLNKKGTIDVAPTKEWVQNPPTITFQGSHSETVTDPKQLERFSGKSGVPISAITEPAGGAEHAPKVGIGTIQQFERVSSNVGGTLTLNYQPLLLKIPKVKLPPQDLPKPPFTVPPNSPKPKP